jgi:hypothetical protein
MLAKMEQEKGGIFRLDFCVENSLYKGFMLCKFDMS